MRTYRNKLWPEKKAAPFGLQNPLEAALIALAKVI